MGKPLDVTGVRYGRLVCLQKADFKGNGKNPPSYWVCECSCGTIKTIALPGLRSGAVRSCGCLLKESATKHGCGRIRTKEYISWASMKARCADITKPTYHSRGINVCEEWKNDFNTFLADMGPAPSKQHTIDRIDNNLGYFKENCRWATPYEQARNRQTNNLLTMNGVTKCILDWSNELGISRGCIAYRLKTGWSVSDALTTPSRKSS